MTPVAEKTRARIFVNASAGFDEKEDAPQQLEQWFEEAGIPAEVTYCRKGVNLAREAAKAVDEGAGIIVAGGGDGTLSAAAAGVVGTDTAFGVLPVGTLNHFARDLNLPLDLEKAARVIADGATTCVDVADVNGRTFLNNAVIGLYPIYRAIRASEERKGFGTRWAWARAVLSTFWRLPFLHLRLWVNGQQIIRRTPYVLIANNEHAMVGWQLGTRTSLTEGKLYLYVMRPQTRMQLLGMLLKLAIGRFHRQHHFDVFSAEEAWLETRSRRLGVSLDGEIHVMETPLHFRSLPQSLRVFVPTS